MLLDRRTSIVSLSIPRIHSIPLYLCCSLGFGRYGKDTLSILTIDHNTPFHNAPSSLILTTLHFVPGGICDSDRTACDSPCCGRMVFHPRKREDFECYRVVGISYDLSLSFGYRRFWITHYCFGENG